MVDECSDFRRCGPSNSCWTDCLHSQQLPPFRRGPLVVGVLPGEGVGPEITECALKVLGQVAEATGIELAIRWGGPVGRSAESAHGSALPAVVVQFCQDVFAQGGAVLSGPGGGRYVYDLRKQLDLFFKISPLQIVNGLPSASRLRPEAVGGVDILVTRENTGGIYQGKWDEQALVRGQRLARHHFEYSEPQVRRFLNASARLALSRRGDLTVVWKDSGLPSISGLWQDCAADAAATVGVRWRLVDVDLMAYRLIQDAAAFDVIAAPNLCGDILADLGAVLLGSRGLSYSGNYTEQGHAVYQTNHGAAYDLAGTDSANPVAQILSMSMMLRETFGLRRQAAAVEAAIRAVWAEGWRTADVAVDGQVIGTSEMGRRIADRAAEFAGGPTVAYHKWEQAA